MNFRDCRVGVVVELINRSGGIESTLGVRGKIVSIDPAPNPQRLFDVKFDDGNTWCCSPRNVRRPIKVEAQKTPRKGNKKVNRGRGRSHNSASRAIALLEECEKHLLVCPKERDLSIEMKKFSLGFRIATFLAEQRQA